MIADGEDMRIEDPDDGNFSDEDDWSMVVEIKGKRKKAGKAQRGQGEEGEGSGSGGANGESGMKKKIPVVWLIVIDVFIAALLLLAADTLGRLLVGSGAMPVGVISSFLGAPMFLYLLLKGYR